METSSKTTFIPIIAIIVAVISLIVAALAISKAGTAESAAKLMRDDLTARIDSTDSAVKTAADNSTRALSQISQVATQTQKAFESVGSEMSTLRTQMNKVTLDLEEMKKRPAPAAAAPGRAPRGEPTIPPGTLTADGEYVIKAGDTLARLARQFNLSLNELENANPGIDPRKMRVGQRIKIPGARPPAAPPAPR